MFHQRRRRIVFSLNEQKKIACWRRAFMIAVRRLQCITERVDATRNRLLAKIASAPTKTHDTDQLSRLEWIKHFARRFEIGSHLQLLDRPDLAYRARGSSRHAKTSLGQLVCDFSRQVVRRNRFFQNGNGIILAQTPRFRWRDRPSPRKCTSKSLIVSCVVNLSQCCLSDGVFLERITSAVER